MDAFAGVPMSRTPQQRDELAMLVGLIVILVVALVCKWMEVQ
jgi:hypothetical protein